MVFSGWEVGKEAVVGRFQVLSDFHVEELF